MRKRARNNCRLRQRCRARHAARRWTPHAPLLFFDSGVGGLSVLGPTRALLPNAPIVYAADSAGFPYGARSEAEIAARVPALLGRLVERFDPRLVVIACNTASTIALDHVRAALDLPIVGTVPAIKPAAEMSKSRVIGVLGTAGDGAPALCRRSRRAASPPIARSSATARPSWSSWPRPSSRGDEVERRRGPRRGRSRCSMRRAASGSTSIVLACTHFPLLDEELARRLPRRRAGRRRRRDRPPHRRI